MKKVQEIMNNDIKERKYKVMDFACSFGNFQTIVFENAELPKTPINCRNCEKQHKTGVLRPKAFCVKNTNYLSVPQVFIQLKCSTCKNLTYMRYLDYLELVSPSKKIKTDMTERNLEIIESVYNVNREDAVKIKKEQDEERKKMFHRMEQERQVRMLNYEEEDRKKKSEEKKRLIQSGELLYDKKNRVFYYKSTGKVYS